MSGRVGERREGRVKEAVGGISLSQGSWVLEPFPFPLLPARYRLTESSNGRSPTIARGPYRWKAVLSSFHFLKTKTQNTPVVRFFFLVVNLPPFEKFTGFFFSPLCPRCRGKEQKNGSEASSSVSLGGGRKCRHACLVFYAGTYVTQLAASKA